MAYTNFTCIDNETLQIKNVYNLTEDGNESEIIMTKDDFCRWGCDNSTHSCSPDPIKKDLTIVGIVLGIGFVLFYIIPKIFNK